jgi:hypothetical protein
VRGADPGAGYRNGYRTGRLKTAEGVVEYAAPQISDRAVPFRSRLRAIIRGRTEELEALAVEMYARGLSTRDIEALFADGDGRSLLSLQRIADLMAWCVVPSSFRKAAAIAPAYAASEFCTRLGRCTTVPFFGTSVPFFAGMFSTPPR